eukprot:scaffold388449_cov25-Prasinocladus_malaysianus.AAC.1
MLNRRSYCGTSTLPAQAITYRTRTIQNRTVAASRVRVFDRSARAADLPAACRRQIDSRSVRY